MSTIILPFISDYEEDIKVQGPTVTYFIEAIGTSRIKIGKTNDVPRRLATLQTGSPFRLAIRATTSIPERELHRRFRRDRVSGEWFTFTDEIAALIEEINNPAKPTENDTDEFYFTPTQASALLATFFVLCGIIWTTFSVNNRDVAPVAPPTAEKTDKARVVVLYQQANPEMNKPVFRSVTAQEVNAMSAGDFQDWAAGVGRRLHDEAKQKYWHNGHPTSKTWLGMQN
ncbi:MAG: GIY-YIG nuclease family protein [Thermoguttaceae bacterium]|jgi:hypothetical protein